jgi:hypothetical protein
MLLGGFSLELLVDGKLLKEYSEPVDKRTVKYLLNIFEYKIIYNFFFFMFINF